VRKFYFDFISNIKIHNYFRPDVWFVSHTQGITKMITVN